MHFDILFEDDHFLAINKPPGILVHRTRLSEDVVFVLQLLRDQVGYPVFTTHRLDRATSGVLIFGKTQEAASALGEHFMDRAIEKKYLVVVRGWAPESGTIDYALSDPETGKENQPAVTHFRCLVQSEQPWPIGLRYPTARFSLLEAEPETGRRHQIRKHLAHINHPIINDKRHGDVKQNTYFWKTLGITRMLLHSARLAFEHPFRQEFVAIEAPLDADFQDALARLGLLTGFTGFF